MINLFFHLVQVFPDPVNTTNFLSQFAYINSLTDIGAGGVLGVTIMLLIFGCLFLIQKAFSYERAFIVSVIITAFVGILLRILNLVNDFVVYVCIAGIILGLWALIKESSQGEV